MKTLLFLLLTLGALHAQENKRPMFYPFDVTIGGQTAVMQKGNILFAVIEKPVAQDALLKINVKTPPPMLIINAFAINEKGEVLNKTQAPGIYFLQNAQSVKLNATMSKKPLAPGRYLANIVANGTTARVVFTIKDTTGKLKLPTLKQVLDFLKK